MNHRIISILNFIFLAFSLCSCKKFVEVDGPPTSVSSKNIYNNDATAIGSITSLYVNLNNNGFMELTGLSCMAGLSADELSYYAGAGNPLLNAYYQNNLSSFNSGGASDYWGVSYQRLFIVNAALEGLQSSKGLTPAVSQHLKGEAYFMRAFYYFYLVNLYGEVPLILNTDYSINAVIKKSSKSELYFQIVKDLKEAQTLLEDAYLKGDLINAYPLGAEERVRPTKWAATALLSRTYLYIGDWANAETQASIVLANAVQFELESLDRVFLKNNKEAIWQLQPTANGHNTEDANTFVLPPEGPSSGNPVYMSKELVDDFDIADQRKTNWIGSLVANGTLYHYPFKYKIKTSTIFEVKEYNTVMRLAEQYLIRAESRAQNGNLLGAISDVNQIRKRAGLTLIDAGNSILNKEDLIKIILKEKRLEYFVEWGHRWLDLKRTNTIDEVMAKITPIKTNGAVWKSYYKYYPINFYELQANQYLTQTPGY